MDALDDSRNAALFDDVLYALRGELEYANAKWADDRTASGGRHTPTEWLVYIRSYVNEALEYTSRNSEPKATNFLLHQLRKIGAMAFNAQMQNGMLTRGIEGPRPEGFNANT